MILVIDKDVLIIEITRRVRKVNRSKIFVCLYQIGSKKVVLLRYGKIFEEIKVVIIRHKLVWF